MNKSVITFVAGTCLLGASSEAGVRVYVEDAAGVGLIKYECTAGEVVRAFALDVTVNRGQIVNVSDYFVGLSTSTARGYGIFPAAFRDHITVSSNAVVNWNVTGYNPLAEVADAPAGTLAGLGTSGVTLEFGALWDPALPAAAPPSSGTLCGLQLSEGAIVTLAANASRGGVVLSPNGNSIVPTFTGAIVTGITVYQAWTAAVGVPAEQADPQLAPQGDGVPNLLKFAFNMDPTKPDVRMLKVGGEGTAGLPGGALADGVLRLEFLRRKAGTDPGITYTPQFGSALDAWTDFDGVESVSPLNPESSTWERVVVDDPAPGQGQRFGRLKVVQTP